MTIKRALEWIKDAVFYVTHHSNKDIAVGKIKEALEVIEKHIEQQSQQGWIPVSERLPEPNKAILISTVDGKVLELCSYNAETNLLVVVVQGGTATIEPQHVLAWMPKPKPYKPKE